jgi:hypothetical protein
MNTTALSNDWLAYANQGATRNLPLADPLVQAMSFLPEMGVRMEVFSGGQPAPGEGPRVGSTRHDHGNAADVFFYDAATGRKLDWSNPNDLPIFQQIVSQARANGITGIGAGDGYMQPGSMHIGFGNEAVWGAGGSSANAPDWLREAYGMPGQPSAQPAQAANRGGNALAAPQAGMMAGQGQTLPGNALARPAPDLVAQQQRQDQAFNALMQNMQRPIYDFRMAGGNALGGMI